VIAAAGLGPEDHVLEIGCGWGSFAIRAASTTGCRCGWQGVLQCAPWIKWERQWVGRGDNGWVGETMADALLSSRLHLQDELVLLWHVSEACCTCKLLVLIRSGLCALPAG
jgi:hypothetical protein